METIQKELLQKAINGLAEDLKESVQTIEASFQTTQNHYGAYMAFIGRFNYEAAKSKILVCALIKAGANKQGVLDAYKLLFNQ